MQAQVQVGAVAGRRGISKEFAPSRRSPAPETEGQNDIGSPRCIPADDKLRRDATPCTATAPRHKSFVEMICNQCLRLHGSFCDGSDAAVKYSPPAAYYMRKCPIAHTKGHSHSLKGNTVTQKQNAVMRPLHINVH